MPKKKPASSSTATTVTGKVMRSETLEWLENVRHISEATLAKLPVADGMATFGEANESSPAIYFAYPNGWKARSFPLKAFTQKSGTKATFWNLDAVLAAEPEEVFITEGEIDALSLVEIGIQAHQVLSAPNASVGELEYVTLAMEAGLNKVKRFILCIDDDDAGNAYRSSLARILGPACCYFVTWPDGAKDANDVLRADGVDFLRTVLSERQPWPTYGLFKMSEIPDPPPIMVWNTGFEEWKDKVYLSPGMLSVVTGHPGHGKTMLFNQVWFQVAKKYKLVVATASFETLAKPHMRRQLRTLHSEMLESVLLATDKDGRLLYHEKLKEADTWIEDHYRFLIHPERRPDLMWLLEQAEIAVIRDGAKVIQIDPWNRLEAARDKGETETDYIGRCLREIYNFARDFNVHVQIMAHPAKSDSYRRGKPPELEDISGSKNWDNMVDQGFVVHRPVLYDKEGKRQTYCEFWHKKARFEEIGFPCHMAMNYDVDQGRYHWIKFPEKKKPQTTATQSDPEPAQQSFTDEDVVP